MAAPGIDAGRSEFSCDGPKSPKSRLSFLDRQRARGRWARAGPSGRRPCAADVARSRPRSALGSVVRADGDDRSGCQLIRGGRAEHLSRAEILTGREGFAYPARGVEPALVAFLDPERQGLVVAGALRRARVLRGGTNPGMRRATRWETTLPRSPRPLADYVKNDRTRTVPPTRWIFRLGSHRRRPPPPSLRVAARVGARNAGRARCMCRG